jgi:hypothetical protein
MTAMKISFLVGYVACASVCGSCGAFALELFRYEPAIVQLSGKVIIEYHYGPPNFGETPDEDQKESVAILDLDAPVGVEADENSSINKDAFNNIGRVQLNGTGKLNLAILAGRHVRLRGTLFEKHTGHHYTDILMNAEDVVVLD